MKQTLSILVENKAGVLTRVSNLFSRRSYNIESIAAGQTDNPLVTRITLSITVAEKQIPQILQLLYKLPDVISARHLLPDEYFSRQLVFIKVRATAETRADICQIADIFRGHVIDISPSSLTIEITGEDDKITALSNMLKTYGIMELVRTGSIAIERGERILAVEY
jgi:acetolactate synthase-1/3 small subunit